MTPSRPLALARILVGCATLLQTPGIRAQLVSLQVPGKFRATYAISPPLVPAFGPLIVGLMVVLGVAVILGWHTRLSLAALAGTLAFLLTLDQQLYRSDMYLLALECGLLAIAESGAALSLDARRGRGRDFVEGWPILLLKIQLSVIYASTALSKINPSFLRGEVLQSALRLDDVPANVVVALSLAAIATECFLALALWFRASRRPAMLVGFLLHSSFLVLLNWGPILVAFEIEILALYVLFPGTSPNECVVVYDSQSPFLRACVKWCERLDWLRACRLDAPADDMKPSAGLLVIHQGKRLSGFEALREIAHVLPATWFLAPLLSLPGFASLGERVYRLLHARERPALSTV